MSIVQRLHVKDDSSLYILGGLTYINEVPSHIGYIPEILYILFERFIVGILCFMLSFRFPPSF